MEHNSDSHKSNEESELNVLLDVAKVKYMKKMGKFVSFEGVANINSAKIKEFHESSLQSSLKLILETRQLKTKQKEKIKYELDQMLAQYLSSLNTQPKVLNLGICINNQRFKIGVYRQTEVEKVNGGGSFKELLSITPEIYFGDEGVFIGQDAGVFSSDQEIEHKYFDVLELITSPLAKPLHRFHCRNIPFTFCTHEVIAAFFLKALGSINCAKGGKIIVTIPFLLVSSTIERITKSLQILGFSQIQILSTFATIAIASIEKSGYYKSLCARPQSSICEKTGKYVIVLDVQRESTSIAIVLIRLHWVYVVASARAENELTDVVKEGRSEREAFLESHRGLYDGVETSIESKAHVFRIFLNMINRLFSNSKMLKKQVYEVVVAEMDCKPNPQTQTKSDLILGTIFDILRRKAHVTHASMDVSPLAGASLLASATTENNRVRGILPPQIQIDDFAKFTHILTTEFEGVERKDLILSWKPIEFTIPFEKLLMGPRSCFIRLFQQYGDGFGSDGNAFEICRYKLTAESHVDLNQNVNMDLSGTFPVRIAFSVDPDGVYELQVATRMSVPVKLVFVKEDLENCESACGRNGSLAFEKIILFLDKGDTSSSYSTQV